MSRNLLRPRTAMHVALVLAACSASAPSPTAESVPADPSTAEASRTAAPAADRLVVVRTER